MNVENFNQYLEKSIFNKKRLKELKNKFQQQQIPKETENIFIEAFLGYLANIYQNLEDYIPFYFENVIMRRKIHEFSTSNEKTEIKKDVKEKIEQLSIELEEKDQFLEKVAVRIQKIYANLYKES